MFTQENVYDVVEVPRQLLVELVALASDGAGDYYSAPHACDMVETKLEPYL